MKKLAIIGNPVSHSLSPRMHSFISKQMKNEISYEAIEVLPQELGLKINMLRNENYSGFNITSPHKIEVIKFLDVISDDAKLYGSVNTAVLKNGKLYGYNTDADGFYLSLLKNGINPKGMDILVLGAGGAAKPVIMKLIRSGAASVCVVNRTKERTEAIKNYVFDTLGVLVDTEISKSHYDLVINCTTLGMGKNIGISPLLDMSVINSKTVVYDMIYNPEQTEFLRLAGLAGAKTMTGLGMLVYQGILAYELFCGITLPDNMAERILNEVF